MGHCDIHNLNKSGCGYRRGDDFARSTGVREARGLRSGGILGKVVTAVGDLGRLVGVHQVARSIIQIDAFPPFLRGLLGIVRMEKSEWNGKTRTDAWFFGCERKPVRLIAAADPDVDRVADRRSLAASAPATPEQRGAKPPAPSFLISLPVAHVRFRAGQKIDHSLLRIICCEWPAQFLVKMAVQVPPLHMGSGVRAALQSGVSSLWPVRRPNGFKLGVWVQSLARLSSSVSVSCEAKRGVG